MTTQEQQLIDGLIQRVNGTNLPDKDPDAEQRLRSGLGSNPNALYILAQTVLVQQYALDQAKQQIDAARAEMDRMRQQASAAPPPPQKHTGFLESIFGGGEHTAPPQPASPPSQGYSPVQNYAPPAQPGYAPQQTTYAPQQSYGAPVGGGFLRGAAQTAAGVAAGALAFEGVESLMHGFGGSGMGGGFGGGAPREEVINNYYGDQGGDRGDRKTGASNESRGFDDNNPTDTNPGDNVFTDANSDANSDDQAGSDDSGSFNDQDTSGTDDFGGSDDSGGFDDNSGGDNSF